MSDVESQGEAPEADLSNVRTQQLCMKDATVAAADG
jgi:hypothetical protein